MGTKAAMSKLYGGMETSTETGYDITLAVPVSKLVSDNSKSNLILCFTEMM
jgi:hypothetical protein